MESISTLFLIVWGRYLFFAGGFYLLCWVWKEKDWQWRKIGEAHPPRRILFREFFWSFVTSVIFAIAGAFIIRHWEGGGTLLYKDFGRYGFLYPVGSLLVLLVLHDAYFYWTHRWLHTKFMFRMAHYVHHESRNPSPWAAFSFHPVESVIEALFLPIVVFCIPIHVGVFLLFLMLMTVLSVINHTGYELYPDSFVRNPILLNVITATHHQMHHRLMNCNYGLYFNWLDRVFKTHHPDYEREYQRIRDRRPNFGKPTYLAIGTQSAIASEAKQSPT